MDGLVVGASAVLGLMIGSFLNVVIWRVPRKESVVRPRSACPSCNTTIRSVDNIPIISWLALGRKCRSCRVPISVRYPLVEFMCAALFALVAWRHTDSAALPVFLVLTATLLAISVIDLEYYIVPNRILGPVTVVSIILLAATALDSDIGIDVFVRAIAGAFAAFGVLLVVHLISPRGMGFGDVKLAFLLGLNLGWLGWGEVMLGFFLAFFLGSVVGIGLILTRVRSRKQHVPFAPFLAAGTMLALLWGDPLIRWYTRV